MKYFLDLIEQFELIINQISSFNTNLINALTLFAEQYKTNDDVSTAFVIIINSKINEADRHKKIFFFHVLDNIVKNVGHLFVTKFAISVKDLIIDAVSLFDNYSERTPYFTMVTSWKGIFALEVMDSLDVELKKIDINWNNDDSLKCLPIITSRGKSENHVVREKMKYENDFRGFEGTEPIWEVIIPDYPLFPVIGTDPRLLRRWYSNEASGHITIDNTCYKLLLNRIQPCVSIDGCLSAVRFHSQSIRILINGKSIELPLIGVTSMRINGRSTQMSLGGPGHELIIYGDPYHVPLDGQCHRKNINGDNVTFEFVLEHPVLVRTMPPIPSFIDRWAWDGNFGSPKNLRLDPLNPMKPKENKNESIANRVPLENLEMNLGNGKFGQSSVTDNGAIRAMQTLNMSTVVRLSRTVLSHSEDKVLSVTDSVDRRHYQLVNDWLVSESPLRRDNGEQSVPIDNRTLKSNVKNETVKYDFQQLAAFEMNNELSKKGKIFQMGSEEVLILKTDHNSVLTLIKGTAEVWGAQIMCNESVTLLNNCTYEVVSFTGCKLSLEGEQRSVQIHRFHENNFRANILLNIHEQVEQRRLESVKNEERGPRILICGPGIESLTMANVARLLANYAVRDGEIVALVNLDTTYNDTTVPNSISVNIVQSQYDLRHGWDKNNDALVFNFGNCSPFIGSSLYFEQLSALANLVNIRCENDNNLLRGGCVINGGSYHSWDIAKRAIDIFEVTVLLVIGDRNIDTVKATLPEFVDIISIPKLGFDSGYCPRKMEQIRQMSIEKYFANGNDCCVHIIASTAVSFFVSEEQSSVYRVRGHGEIVSNTIGALSQASSEQLITTSPVLLYCIFVCYSKEESTVKLLTNERTWPEKTLSLIVLSGNVWK